MERETRFRNGIALLYGDGTFRFKSSVFGNDGDSSSTFL